MFSIRKTFSFSSRRFSFAFVRRSNSNESNKIVERKTPKSIETFSPNDSSLWKTSETNKLIEYLAARIQNRGPITVADFMKESLLNSQFGFYGRKEQSKRKDDLIQTDSVRRLFAESISTWILGQHESVAEQFLQLVELGPGTGRLTKILSEILHEKKYDNLHTYFVLYEPNPLMRRRQAETILGRSFDPALFSDYRIKPGEFSLIWTDNFKQLLKMNTYFIGLEFFNSYPVHKFHKTKNGWKEVMIDWNKMTKRLQYVLASQPTMMARLYENFLNGTTDRKHIEISPQRDLFLQIVAKQVSRHQGSMLIADFAHWGDGEDTFRAYRDEQLVDPLSDPGNVENVVDVDFQQLVQRGIESANRLNFSSDRHLDFLDELFLHLILVQFFGPLTQSQFLYNTRMNERLEILVKNKSREEEDEIFEDVERLVSSDHMGDRILYLCAQNSDRFHAPQGFKAISQE